MQISDIQAKILEVNEDGELTITIKAMVMNDSDNSDVFFTLQGIDDEDFEIFAEILVGNIPINDTEIMTKMIEDVDADTFNNIVKWQGS